MLQRNGKMWLMAFGAAAMVTGSAVGSVRAGVIVSETFDADGSLTDYAGTGEAFADYVQSGTIVAEATGGEFNMQLIEDEDGSLHTRIDLGGAKSLLSLQVDFKGIDSASASNAFSIYVGSFAAATDFDPGWNPVGPNLRNWSRVSVRHDNQISVYDAQNDVAATYSQPLEQFETWSLFFNQSGAAQSFVGPDNQSYNLNNNAWTMFVGETLVAANIAKGFEGDSADMQGIIFHINRNHLGARTNVSIDNLIVRDDLALIPEPASLALLGVGGVLMVARRRTSSQSAAS